ncbi:sugar MFS transporter [Dysgonomonas sp. 511]|uniref:MFS transporter n=1 Tax=Dysgonomonas sp. 511 TaxID=2302930 RepID=UPI0013D49EF6|nr:MFS transporter [Dysgonomonas sp. 511]NDV78116.1 MFS transporter [Dysgonomonas sp. 511]
MITFDKTRVYIAACIGMMFFGVAFIVMGSVLPAMTLKYGLNEIQSSSLVTFLPIGVLVGSLLFGPVVDRFGYKSLLITSTVLVGLGLLGLSYFDDFNVLRLFIFIIGLGGGILNGETNAIVAEIYSGDKSASKLSLLGMCYGIGALGVPLILSFFSAKYSYEVILRWTTLVILLSVVYFSFTKFPESKYKQGFPIRSALKLIKEPVLLLMGFILFFQSGLEGLFNNWSTTYLINANIGHDEALLALTALVAGITVARLLLSYLLTRVNTQYILYAGLLILAAGIAVLNYAGSFWGGAVALFIVGIGLAGVFPIVIGRIGTLYKEMSGTAIGFALFIALSGNSLLNLLMGVVAKEYQIAVFPVFLIVCVAIQGLLILISKKHMN